MVVQNQVIFCDKYYETNICYAKTKVVTSLVRLGCKT